MPTRHRVVVGVDGSIASEPTIRWATVEAAARRASLHVVSFGAEVTRSGRRSTRESRDILLDEAATSDLMIVGGSTSGAATRWLRICVPRGGSRRSSCPIVVVRGDASQPLRRIVVGIDSPSTPQGVVDWAADEAGHHDAELSHRPRLATKQAARSFGERQGSGPSQRPMRRRSRRPAMRGTIGVHGAW